MSVKLMEREWEVWLDEVLVDSLVMLMGLVLGMLLDKLMEWLLVKWKEMQWGRVKEELLENLLGWVWEGLKGKKLEVWKGWELV